MALGLAPARATSSPRDRRGQREWWNKQVLHEIVEQAARAPSIHNTQPWRFVAHDDVLELWTDPTRGLAVLDPSGRAATSPAVLHCSTPGSRLRAPGCATVTLLPDPDEPDHLADLSLCRRSRRPRTASWSGRSPPAARLERPSATSQLPREVVSALRHAAELEGCWLRIVDDRADAAGVAVLLARADDLAGRRSGLPRRAAPMDGRTAEDTEGVPDSAVPSRPPSSRGSNFRLRDFVADRDDEPATGESDEPPPVERPLIAVLGTR